MIYYFSATGNSRYVAERLADAIGEQATSILDLIRTNEHHITLPQGETLVFVLPTYHYSVPNIVRDWLQQTHIDCQASNKVYVVATYGTSSGYLVRKMSRWLAQKKITVTGAAGICMPDTFTPHHDLSDKVAVERINQEADKAIDTLCEQIKAGEKIRFKETMPRFVCAGWHWYAYRHFTTEPFTVSEACIGCGLCAKNCTSQVIEMQADTYESDKKIKQHPVWTNTHCEMCLRCLHSCPKFAIQYGDKTRAHGQYRHAKFSN